jgi:hypothetical protein
MTFRQGKDDADMKTMLTSMCGAWIARFYKPRRRSKVDPVRVPKVEAQKNSSSSPVRSPGPVHTKNDAQVTYEVGFGRWLEAEFHDVSNGIGLRPKFVLSQRESSKEVNIQNLSGCCANTFWAVGPIEGPCGPRVP